MSPFCFPASPQFPPRPVIHFDLPLAFDPLSESLLSAIAQPSLLAPDSSLEPLSGSS